MASIQRIYELNGGVKYGTGKRIGAHHWRECCRWHRHGCGLGHVFSIPYSRFGPLGVMIYCTQHTVWHHHSDRPMLRESGSKLGSPKSPTPTDPQWTIHRFPAWTRRCSRATCQHQVTLRRCQRLKPLGENLQGVKWEPSWNHRCQWHMFDSQKLFTNIQFIVYS